MTQRRAGEAGAIADAKPGNLVDRLAPVAALPYLRLARIDRPIGWWLLLLPCWWSSGLAAIAAGRAGPDPWHCALFLVGAVAMRGAGSTFNDLVDRDLDAKVERTAGRPLPSGAVSPRAAFAFLVALALLGLLVLLQFDRFTVLLGIASLAPVAVYPFMKRVMPLPQLVLGFAFSWGALMGWAALFGRLDPPALLLYAAAIAWTVGYDTIYALQDLEDDAVAGIKSSARLFGRLTRLAVGVCFAAASVLVAASLAGAGAGPLAFAGLAAFAAHLAWQTARLRLDEPRLALRLFRSNREAGLLLFAGLCADAFARQV